MNKSLCICILIIINISCKAPVKIISKSDFKNSYKFDFEIHEKIKKDSIEPDYQLSATYFSAKANHKMALIHWDLATNPQIESFSKNQIDSINNKYRVFSAKKFIINQSLKNKIIIINESHHNGSHRVFTESLLQDLFNNGYKNLCLEALYNGKDRDSLMNLRKYPIQSSGFYTQNPQYGNLIRTALKIGYTIHPYETTQDEGGALREEDQANNILKIINDNPNEKFLIFCGSGHALEGDVSFFGGRALAGRINDLTGINPLTVDQVFYSEKSTEDNNNALLKAINVNEPSILLDKSDSPFSYNNKTYNRWIDIVVFHPNTKYINNRPKWLLKNDNTKLLEVNIKDLKINFPIMIMAFVQKEDINYAIPYDIIELENKDDLSFLVLEKGKYKIIIMNQQGKLMEYNKKVR